MTLLRVYPIIGVVINRILLNLKKVSNDILTGLTDQGNTWATKFYKFNFLSKNIIHENSHLNMFGWCLTVDAVYI